MLLATTDSLSWVLQDPTAGPTNCSLG